MPEPATRRGLTGPVRARAVGNGDEHLCAVHLVRIGEPISSFVRFLNSYRVHVAGVEHRLVLLFKGFERERELARYRALAEEISYTELRVDDQGFDLNAYRRAADMLQARRYCVLNSHSEILSDNWLAHLVHALDSPAVGLAGATGSWASQHSYARLQLGLRNAYDDVFDDRRTALRMLQGLETPAPEGHGRSPTSEEGLARLRNRWASLRAVPETIRVMRGFGPFPEPHIRTNAFAIGHADLLSAIPSRLTSKLETHRLESGPGSLTRRIERLSLRAVVVDRQGREYEQSDWPASWTFWRGSQEGLLIADNQTERYLRGDRDLRLALSRYAWGAQADVGKPALASR